MLVEIEELKKDLETFPVEAIESIVSTINTRGVFIQRKSYKDELRTIEYMRHSYSECLSFCFLDKYKDNKDDSSNLEEIDKDISDLLSALYENQNQKSYNACMYKIYDQFAIWNKSKWYSKCDKFLRYIEPEDFDVRVLLSLLMASLPMKQNLNYRREFYDSVLRRARLVYSSSEINSIFVGLD